MRKGWIAGVVILMLFLAAWNVRLAERARLLEEQLAAAAKPKRVPRPVDVPVSPPPSPTISPQAPAPTPVPSPAAKLPEKLTLPPGPTLTFTVQGLAPEPDPAAGPRSGFLGISGEDVPGGGVKINTIIAGSVAEKAGLRAGDVILEYNGEPVSGLAALTGRIRGGGEGSPVSLRIRRDNTEFYQGVQLGARN